MGKDQTILEILRELVPEAYHADDPRNPNENYARLSGTLQRCGVYIEDSDMAVRSVVLRSTVNTNDRYSNSTSQNGKVAETWGDAVRRVASTVYTALLSSTVRTAVIVLSMERPRAKEMELDNNRTNTHVPLSERNPDVAARLPADFSANQICAETWHDIMYNKERFMAFRVFFTRFLLEELALPVGKSLIVYGGARKVPQSPDGSGDVMQNLFYAHPVMVYGEPTSGSRTISRLPGAPDYAREYFEDGKWKIQLLNNGDADEQVISAMTHFSSVEDRGSGILIRSADIDIHLGALLALDFQQRLTPPRPLPTVIYIHQMSVGSYKASSTDPSIPDRSIPQNVTEYVNITVLAHRLSILTDRAFPTKDEDDAPSAGVLYLFLVFLMRGCDFTRMTLSGYTMPILWEALFKNASSLSGMLGYRPADTTEPGDVNCVMHIYLDFELFRRFCELSIMHKLNKRVKAAQIVLTQDIEVQRAMPTEAELRVSAANIVWTMFMVVNSYKHGVRFLPEFDTIDCGREEGVLSLNGYVENPITHRCEYATKVAPLRMYTSDRRLIEEQREHIAAVADKARFSGKEMTMAAAAAAVASSSSLTLFDSDNDSLNFD